MTEHRRDGIQRAVRTWLQGLAIAVGLNAWPVLAPVVRGDGADPVDWSMLGHDLRLVIGVAVASYVQRTLVDPRRQESRARRVRGYLTTGDE